MSARVPTGIVQLDRKLGGGIPPGHTVLLTAPPASQSELFLTSITRENETLYLTAERSDSSIQRTLEQDRSASDGTEIHSVEATEPLVSASDALRNRDLPQVLIIDRIGPFERRDRDRFRAFLELLDRTASAASTVVVMHGIKGAEPPSQRGRTTYMADVVFELVSEFDGTTVENRLFVPKFRGGRALKDPLALDLTERIVVDNSRDIA